MKAQTHTGHRTLALASLLLVLGACSIDSTVYQPGNGDGGDDDDGDGGIDAPPDGIHVQVTPSTTTVSEGGQATVQVRLSEAPPADRTIDVTGAALLTPTPSQLVFTPENWNVNRTVILAAGQDDDAADSPVTVLFNGNGLVADGSAMVMITDDDFMGLVVTPPSSLGVTEGNSGQVQVQLSARPTSSVVVSVSTMDTAVATVSTPQLTFTSSNWDTSQAVTVTGAGDADTGDNTTVLILDPATEGVPTHTLAINVTDDDVVAIDANPTNLGTLTEAAGANHSGVIAVRLTQVPAGNVVIDLAATPAAAVTLSQNQLTFTPGNYATVQNVTVTAASDGNVVDEQVSIQLSATGLATRFVQATIADDDVQVINVAPAGAIAVTEGGGANVNVTLAFEPAGAVLVDVISGDPTIATVSLAQLTFGPTTYATPQAVRISGTEDADLANESTLISFNGTGGLTTNRTANVTDDDTQTLEVAPTTLAVAEGGQATFNVHLRYQPAASVTVNVGTTNTTDIGVAPASLTFGPGDYDTDKPVTVTGLQDGDVSNETAMVTVSSSGLTPRAVTVDVSDDDALDILVTPVSIAVTEGGPAQNLMVSLGAMPAGNVTVTLTATPTGVASLGAGTVVFTPVNYATPQPVSVTATQDPDGADETTTIRLGAPSLDEKTVPVSVTDDEVIAPVLSANPVTIEEGKPDTSLTLRLSHDPGRSITVEVPTFGFTDFEVSPTLYTFDGTNWNVPQPVTLFADEDDTADPEVENALFQIAGEGSANLTVNTTDPTVLLGFPAPHQNTPAGFTGLEGFRDGSLPACFVIEKVAFDVLNAPTAFSAIAIGLYNDGITTPATLAWESRAITLGMGSGIRVIDITDIQVSSVALGSTWIAVEATTAVTLKTRSGTVAHCSRAHAFGDFMPNPFNGGGTGLPPDAGLDGGGATVTCVDRPAPAVWLIGRPAATCVDPA